MIGDVEKLKKQLYEIQCSNKNIYTTAPSDEPHFVIDANTRKIDIPVEFSFLGVRNDHCAETIYFEIDRYFDKKDLSAYTCVVQFINAPLNEGEKANEGIYPITDMDITSAEGKIIFGWSIQNDATYIHGTIHFSVRFYSINSDGTFLYNFNTLPANSSILDTLNVKDFVITNITPSQVQVWINKMNELSAQFQTLGEEINSLRDVKDKLLNDSNELIDNCIDKAEKAEEAARSAYEAEKDARDAAEKAMKAKERCDNIFYIIDGGNAFTNPLFTLDGGTADGSAINIVKRT